MNPKPADSNTRNVASSQSGSDKINQNIETILSFYSSEEEKISRSQRVLENASDFLGRPLYLGFILLFTVSWIAANLLAIRFGWSPFDAPPFYWLEGIISLVALLTTTVVLIRQNRVAKLEEQHAHLALQVNLLTEQKATKLIQLIEELRRDMPMVKDRHDPEAAQFQQTTDPRRVLDALDERLQSEEGSPNHGKR